MGSQALKERMLFCVETLYNNPEQIHTKRLTPERVEFKNKLSKQFLLNKRS